MADNQFVPFATGNGANTLSAAAFIALAVRQAGFQPGIASSTQVNTALRQSSSVAAMIGAFIAKRATVDALDNGDITTLETNFETALANYIAGNISGPSATSLWHAGDDVGTANNLIVAAQPALTGYARYIVVQARVAVTNTGPSSINVNGLGTRAIVRGDGSALKAGDLLAGELVTLAYDGANFQIINYIQSALDLLNALKIVGGTPTIYPTPGNYQLSIGANVTFSVRECRGGGGGGGGANNIAGVGKAGAGGGGGGNTQKTGTTTAATVLGITVGAGGQPGTGAPTSGTAGGTTTITIISGSVTAINGAVYTAGMTFCSSTGGGGGPNNQIDQVANQGLGGVGANGDVNDTGDRGGYGIPLGGGGWLGGYGGGSPGSGSSQPANYNAAGNSSQASGTGGNGSSLDGASGGNGTPGRVTIYR